MGHLRYGTIEQVSSTSAEMQQLRDLAVLRRVRDRIDREYAQPLDVEALARGAHMSAGDQTDQESRSTGLESVPIVRFERDRHNSRRSNHDRLYH